MMSSCDMRKHASLLLHQGWGTYSVRLDDWELPVQRRSMRCGQSKLCSDLRTMLWYKGRQPCVMLLSEQRPPLCCSTHRACFLEILQGAASRPVQLHPATRQPAAHLHPGS